MPTPNPTNREKPEVYEKGSSAKPIITADSTKYRGYENEQNLGISQRQESDRNRYSISSFLAGVFLTLILGSAVGIVLFFVFTPDNSSEESSPEMSKQNKSLNLSDKIIRKSQRKLSSDLQKSASSSSKLSDTSSFLKTEKE